MILSVPIVGIPCYFFFGRPELTSKTQKRMARIVEAYAPLRPENELLNETLRQTDMDAYRPVSYTHLKGKALFRAKPEHL